MTFPKEILFLIFEKADPLTKWNLYRTPHFRKLIKTQLVAKLPLDDYHKMYKIIKGGDLIALYLCFKDKDLVKYIKNSKKFIKCITKYLCIYVKYKNIVKFIERMDYYNKIRITKYICLFGYTAIAKKIIESKIVSNDDRSYGSNIKFLDNACKSGNVHTMREIFKSVCIKMNMIEYNEFLECACRVGNLEYVNKYLEIIGKKLSDLNLNAALSGACESGNKPLVEYIIGKGATDFNDGLSSACLRNHIHIAKYMILKGATNFNEAFEMACYGRNKEAAKFLIDYPLPGKYINFVRGFDMAIWKRNINFAKWLYSEYKEIRNIFANSYLISKMKDKKLIDYITGTT